MSEAHLACHLNFHDQPNSQHLPVTVVAEVNFIEDID
jgi:hypothetical protein